MSRVLLWSLGVGVIVQAIAYGIVLAVPMRHRLTGRGAGILLRMGALGLFAWAAHGPLGLPLAPALLILAGFFFVTTLLEPIVLKC